MQKLNDARVLSRLGARELTPEEYTYVNGGAITNVLTKCISCDQHTDG